MHVHTFLGGMSILCVPTPPCRVSTPSENGKRGAQATPHRPQLPYFSHFTCPHLTDGKRGGGAQADPQPTADGQAVLRARQGCAQMSTHPYSPTLHVSTPCRRQMQRWGRPTGHSWLPVHSQSPQGCAQRGHLRPRSPSLAETGGPACTQTPGRCGCTRVWMDKGVDGQGCRWSRVWIDKGVDGQRCGGQGCANMHMDKQTLTLNSPTPNPTTHTHTYTQRSTPTPYSTHRPIASDKQQRVHTPTDQSPPAHFSTHPHTVPSPPTSRSMSTPARSADANSCHNMHAYVVS